MIVGATNLARAGKRAARGENDLVEKFILSGEYDRDPAGALRNRSPRDGSLSDNRAGRKEIRPSRAVRCGPVNFLQKDGRPNEKGLLDDGLLCLDVARALILQPSDVPRQEAF